MQKKLSQLNHLIGVWFDIEEFYEADFTVKENIITLGTYPTRYYGINSLVKVLIDLGEVGLNRTATQTVPILKDERS